VCRLHAQPGYVHACVQCHWSWRSGAQPRSTSFVSAVRVRRKSRDLSEALNDVARSADGWRQAATSLIDRNSNADFDEAELREAFDKIDIDKSGKIDAGELEQVRGLRLPRPATTIHVPSHIHSLRFIAQVASSTRSVVSSRCHTCIPIQYIGGWYYRLLITADRF